MTLSRGARWLMSRPLARKPAATRRAAAFRPTLAGLEAREVPAVTPFGDPLPPIDLASQSPVTSKDALELGQIYRLVASGTGTISTAIGLQTDAEYVLRATGHDTNGVYRGTPSDNRLQVGGVSGFNGWGGFRSKHVYTTDVIGTGNPLSAYYRDVHSTSYADNAGSLALAVHKVTDAVVTPARSADASEAGSTPSAVTKGKFRFMRGGDLSQSVTVNVEFLKGTGLAESGVDFTAPTSVTFAANQGTAYLEVTPRKDNRVEGSETVRVRIIEGEGYAGIGKTASLALADDAPVVSVAAGKGASEAGADAQSVTVGRFVFSRTGGDLSQPLTVSYGVETASTAEFGADYTLTDSAGNDAGGMVTLPGGGGPAELFVTPKKDNLVEGPEVVRLRVIDIPLITYTAGANGEAEVAIADDPPVVELIAQNTHVTEGDLFEGVRVFRSGGNTGEYLEVTVSFDPPASGASAEWLVDYFVAGIPNSGANRHTVSLAPNQLDAVIPVQTYYDDITEGLESFDVGIVFDYPPVYVAGGTTTQRVSMAEDNDAPAAPKNLEYFENIGWIDWNHANKDFADIVIKSIREALKSSGFNSPNKVDAPNFSESNNSEQVAIPERFQRNGAGARTITLQVPQFGYGGYLKRVVMPQIKYVFGDLTEGQVLPVAMAIYQDYQMMYELWQEATLSNFGVLSGYSQEDLMSDLVGFHMAVDPKLTKEYLKANLLGKQLGADAAAKLLQDLGGNLGWRANKNRKWEPVNHNAKVGFGPMNVPNVLNSINGADPNLNVLWDRLDPDDAWASKLALLAQTATAKLSK